MQKWMHPLLPEELGDDFSLDRVLRNGSIPLIWTSGNPKEQLLAYFELYLKEEIQAEAIQALSEPQKDNWRGSRSRKEALYLRGLSRRHSKLTGSSGALIAIKFLIGLRAKIPWRLALWFSGGKN